MHSIIRATVKDYSLLARIGEKTFLESHGHSAPLADIENYVQEKYNDEACLLELENPKNIYHFIYHEGQAAGFSKIIPDEPHPQIDNPRLTKLERIYILRKYYHLKLGWSLLHHNIEISKAFAQQGMWLYVWKENERAIRFYSNNGFRISGSHDFKISETHSNPNHIMFLDYAVPAIPSRGSVLPE
ncbi:MAG: GNAT family N-acetyltransferase [Terrimonas sp.]|nr:GNAT family N-acetyltransferase [Terrimonas sp.]